VASLPFPLVWDSVEPPVVKRDEINTSTCFVQLYVLQMKNYSIITLCHDRVVELIHPSPWDRWTIERLEKETLPDAAVQTKVGGGDGSKWKCRRVR
jgi:hypothetical protein